MKHFELVENETRSVDGHILHRIKATEDFGSIKAGTIGGFVESLDNLDGNAWVYDNAQVWGEAKVYDNAQVYDHACVYGNALIYDNAQVYGRSYVWGGQVYGNARIFGSAGVSDNAKVFGHAQVFEYAWISDNAQVYDDAVVFGEARVYGNSWVEKDAQVYGDARIFGNATISRGSVKRDGEVINITSNGLLYPITVFSKYIQIGKECHTKTAWLRFTDNKIQQMFGEEEITWWKTWKPILESICNANE